MSVEDAICSPNLKNNSALLEMLKRMDIQDEFIFFIQTDFQVQFVDTHQTSILFNDGTHCVTGYIHIYFSKLGNIFT